MVRFVNVFIQSTWTMVNRCLDTPVMGVVRELEQKGRCIKSLRSYLRIWLVHQAALETSPFCLAHVGTTQPKIALIETVTAHFSPHRKVPFGLRLSLR